jgi:hypothetical protein
MRITEKHLRQIIREELGVKSLNENRNNVNPDAAAKLLSYMSDETLAMGLEDPRDPSLLTPIEEILHFHMGYEFAPDAERAAYPFFVYLRDNDSYREEAARDRRRRLGRQGRRN